MNSPSDVRKTPGVRRANTFLLIGMIAFAFALTAIVLLWMYGRMKRQQALERQGADAAGWQQWCEPPRISSARKVASV